MQTTKRLVRIDDTRAIELTTYTPEPSEPAYPAFDTAKPTDAERIAKLEARVRELETEINALKRVAGVAIAYPRTEAVNALTVDLEGVDVTTWDSKWTEE